MREFFQLLSLLLMLVSAPVFAAETTASPHISTHKLKSVDLEIRYFYKNPSYGKLIAIINNLPTLQNPDMIITFISMAIVSHPDYANKIHDHFASYPTNTKTLLFNSLLASGHKNIATSITEKYHFSTGENFRNCADDLNNLTLPDMIKQEETFDVLDILWSAYFATGNSLYLQKLLEYINADPVYLIIGYEMLNRDFTCNMMRKFSKEDASKNPICEMDDVKKAIKKYSPSNYEKGFKRADCVRAAIWSMDSNRHQDPTIDAKVKEIFHKHPDLNYEMKIKKAIR